MPIIDTAPSIDIFCRVIDNYGDIGVCWRLARHLRALTTPPKAHTTTSPELVDPHISADLMHAESSANTLNATVLRLWVDDLASFQRIEPRLLTQQEVQQLDSIIICAWRDRPQAWAEVTPAELVIESFGCDLPLPYRQAMTNQTRCWLNLDYLSAESWVEEFHLQPSIQDNGVPKYFFYPGFSAQTGGLLRDEAQHRERLQNASSADKKQAALATFVEPTNLEFYRRTTPLVISLFCYNHAPIDALMGSLPADQPVLLLVPEGVAPTFEQLLPTAQTQTRVQRLPFLPQKDYDQLLYLCDLNFVRGEDSFVQAHWTGQPMIWHIYPQDKQHHMIKLSAWLDRIQAPGWLRQLHLAWNGHPDHQGICFKNKLKNHFFDPVARLQWQQLQQHLATALIQQPPLAQQILNFFENSTLKHH